MSTRTDRLLHELSESGQDYADKKAAANALEELRRNLMAKLIRQRMSHGDSRSGAEEQARCTDQFARATQEMLAAQKAAIKAKMRYDLAGTAVDLYRTEAATKRAELENLHLTT